MTTTETITPTAAKIRTITLTNRAPVRIVEDEWPLIASAKDRSRVCYHTPIPDYETDGYSIRVRQHADGRTLVYAVLDAASAWTGSEDRRGGELLGALVANGKPLTTPVTEAEIIAAIRRVGDDCNLPDSVVRACIADLPAVTL